MSGDEECEWIEWLLRQVCEMHQVNGKDIFLDLKKRL